MLQAKDLSIGYRHSIAQLEELSLIQGQILALVGRNGTGKTTLLKTLQGQLPALQGEVTLHNQSILSLSVDALSKEIAWVDTRFQGVPHLTVYDYVLLGRTPYFNAIGTATPTDLVAVKKALEQVGITVLKDKETTEISDGERQLASIARALAQETPLLFLDEPTAFLDFHHRKVIFTLLKHIAVEQSKGILLSTHELDLVVAHQLHLLVVRQDGNITQQNPVENVAKLESWLT